MNTIRKLLLILFFIHLLNDASAGGMKLYVEIHGDDNNPGTREAPMATLGNAVKKVRQMRKVQRFDSPVEIIVGEGEYFLSAPLEFDPQDSGTEESPLIIRAAEGSRPVFTGGKKIQGFEKISENLWAAKIPESEIHGWYFEQLFVNGRRATRARTPNKGFYLPASVSETVVVKGKGRFPELSVKKLVLKEEAMRALDSLQEKDAGQAIITLHHKWNVSVKRISFLNRDSCALYTMEQGMPPWNKLDGESRFYIENLKSLMDTCGEWYLDKKGILFYIPMPGETIGNTTVIAPVNEKFIILRGNEKEGLKVQNIRFENLSFMYSGYKMPFEGIPPAQAAHSQEAAIMADFASGISFVNCEIAGTGTYALWFRKACSDCRMEHCFLHDLGAGGVKVGDYIMPENPADLTRNVTVDNNIIRGGGYIFPAAVGVILFQASDNRIVHNEIADFRYSGISVGWVWGYSHSPAKRNIIEYNHIHHLGWGVLCDMGGVYCLGISEGTSVSNNVIHHVYSHDYGGWGLYTDEGSTGIIMENNLVYKCKNSGFHQHYGKENIIRNNIFTDNMKAQLQATRIEDHLSFNFVNNIVWFKTGTLTSSNWTKINLMADHNCYWDANNQKISFGPFSFAEWKKSGKDLHSVEEDPEFEDPSSADFRIKNKSVMRKTGFREFDYSRAGVYGSEEWKKKAVLDPLVEAAFEEAVLRNENRQH